MGRRSDHLSLWRLYRGHYRCAAEGAGAVGGAYGWRTRRPYEAWRATQLSGWETHRRCRSARHVPVLPAKREGQREAAERREACEVPTQGWNSAR